MVYTKKIHIRYWNIENIGIIFIHMKEKFYSKLRGVRTK